MRRQLLVRAIWLGAGLIALLLVRFISESTYIDHNFNPQRVNPPCYGVACDLGSGAFQP